MWEFIDPPQQQTLQWSLDNKYPSFTRSFKQAQMEIVCRDLPVHHINRANDLGLDLRLLAQSKKMNERVINESLDRPMVAYNCWGFVAAMKGWHPGLVWLGCDDMKRYLRKHLVPMQIKLHEAQQGDVAVYHAWGCLQHTALCLGNGMLIHKPGPLDLEIVSFEKLNEWHGHSYGPVAYIGRERENVPQTL